MIADIFVLFLILGESINFFTIKYDVHCFSQILLSGQGSPILFLFCCYYHCFVFIMKRCWIFFLFIEIILGFLIFYSITMTSFYIDYFSYVKPTLHDWDKTNLITVYNILYFVIFNRIICLKKFCLYS